MTIKILHEGNFNTPKVFEENGHYYTECREIPKQCCLTCKNSSIYNNGVQCQYAKFDENYSIICRNNIEDDFEAF